MNTPPFGELLQALRKRRHLGQQALADKLGVHRNTISAWERGEWLPGTRGIVVELGGVLRLDGNEAAKLMEAALFQGTQRMSEDSQWITKRRFVQARALDEGPMTAEDLLHRLDIMLNGLKSNEQPKMKQATNVLHGALIRLCQLVDNKEVTEKINEILDITMEITGI